MSKEEIVQTVKINYEVVLEEFRVYDSAKELYENEKGNLSIYASETLGENLGEEENVFRAGDKWIYAKEWHDADWD